MFNKFIIFFFFNYIFGFKVDSEKFLKRITFSLSVLLAIERFYSYSYKINEKGKEEK